MHESRAARVCLAIAALSFLSIGIGHLVSPVGMVEPLQIQLGSVNALNEIRANYGGMHLLMGVFFFYGAVAARFRDAALLAVAVFTSGLVLGRLASLVIDGIPGSFVLLLLAGELVLAVAACVLVRRRG